MLEGKTCLPEQGTPIWKTVRRRTMCAVWLPVPFTVPTRITKSFAGRAAGAAPAAAVGDGDGDGVFTGRPPRCGETVRDSTPQGGQRRTEHRATTGAGAPRQGEGDGEQHLALRSARRAAR